MPMACRQFLPPYDFTAGRNRHGARMRARVARRGIEFPREILAAPVAHRLLDRVCGCDLRIRPPWRMAPYGPRDAPVSEIPDERNWRAWRQRLLAGRDQAICPESVQPDRPQRRR